MAPLLKSELTEPLGHILHQALVLKSPRMKMARNIRLRVEKTAVMVVKNDGIVGILPPKIGSKVRAGQRRGLTGAAGEHSMAACDWTGRCVW